MPCVRQVAAASCSCCLEPALCLAADIEESSDNSSSGTEQEEASESEYTSSSDDDDDEEEEEEEWTAHMKNKNKAPARKKKGPCIGHWRAMRTYCLDESDLTKMKDVKTTYNNLFGGEPATAARACAPACKHTVVCILCVVPPE